MEWGDKEGLLKSAAEKFGRIPNALQVKPIVSETSEALIQAFSLLYSGVPLSLSDIVLYCELTGLSDKLRIIAVFKTLEKIVVNHSNKKLKDGRPARR